MTAKAKKRKLTKLKMVRLIHKRIRKLRQPEYGDFWKSSENKRWLDVLKDFS